MTGPRTWPSAVAKFHRAVLRALSGAPLTRLDYIKAELLAPGEISFTSDPQLGKAARHVLRSLMFLDVLVLHLQAVITADSWDEMCDNAAEYFRPGTQRAPTSHLHWSVWPECPGCASLQSWELLGRLLNM